MSRRAAVSVAVRFVAQERATFLHLLGALRRPLGVHLLAIGVGCRGQVPPIIDPLPDIPNHVVQPRIVLRGVCVDRCGKVPPVCSRVLLGEIALPKIGPVLVGTISHPTESESVRVHLRDAPSPRQPPTSRSGPRGAGSHCEAYSHSASVGRMPRPHAQRRRRHSMRPAQRDDVRFEHVRAWPPGSSHVDH